MVQWVIGEGQWDQMVQWEGIWDQWVRWEVLWEDQWVLWEDQWEDGVQEVEVGEDHEVDLTVEDSEDNLMAEAGEEEA